MKTPLEKVRDRHIGKLLLERRHLNRYNLYYEGEQPLRFIAPQVRQELGNRITEVALNWPRFGVEAYDNRLDIEGFRFAGSDSSDEELWSVWQANDGPLLSQQAHQEHLALSRAYTIVGPGDGDIPLITGESAFECVHELDPRTHDVSSGIKRWVDLDLEQWVTLYYPDGFTTWRRQNGDWVVDTERQTDWGLCALVPLVHSPRSLAPFRPAHRDERLGRSIFHDIIPIADAANKMVTDMMVSGEFHAMPRRYAVGLTEKDFVDEEGNPLDTWELAAGAIWTSENKDAKMGQFPESDLSVFHNSIKLLAQLASQMLGLPPHYLSFTGDNPASADAIRSAEVQLVKRAERIQTVLSTRWERVQRLVLLELGNQDTPDAQQIETQWRDPATPTKAQQADATQKLVASGVIPKQQAWEDLGYTAQQQARMADWFAQNQADPQITAATRQLSFLGPPVEPDPTAAPDITP